MKAKRNRARIFRRVPLGHQLRPQLSRGAELRDLFDEVVVRVEKEGDARRERVDVEAALDRGSDVLQTVRECERDLLHGRRAGFANVVAGDGDRVPARHFARAELEDVGDDAERRRRRKDVSAARRILFEDVVLNRAVEFRPGDAATLRDHDQQREENRGRRVDRHRDGHAVERNLVEERFHVGDGVDGDADFSDFASRARVVRIHPDLRRQIERDGESGRAALEQVTVAFVGFDGGGKPGVLAHRPELSAIHRRLRTARVREGAGSAKIGGGIEAARGQIGLVEVRLFVRHARRNLSGPSRL